MRRALFVPLVTGLLIAGCGSDDDGDATDPDVVSDADAGSGDEATDVGEAASSDDVDPAEGGTDTAGDDDAAADDAAADDAAEPATPTGSGTATVTFEGSTYSFAQIEPGPDDDWYVFCTNVAGSLQAVLRQIDDAGNPVDGELSVILIEPGSPYDDTGDPPEVAVEVNNERFLRYQDGDPIDAPASGTAGGGTVTLSESGAMDPQTGEIEMTPVEVSLEVAC